MVPFAGNTMSKLFLARFRHRCCCDATMGPCGYFIILIWPSDQFEFETPVLDLLFVVLGAVFFVRCHSLDNVKVNASLFADTDPASMPVQCTEKEVFRTGLSSNALSIDHRFVLSDRLDCCKWPAFRIPIWEKSLLKQWRLNASCFSEGVNASNMLLQMNLGCQWAFNLCCVFMLFVTFGIVYNY